MRSLRASATAVVTAVLLAGGALIAPPAVAATPSADILGDTLYAEDFENSDDWSLISGTTTAWGAANGDLTFDTLLEGSGRYVRPATGPTLPESYELRTRMRIDEMKSDGTVSVLLDMTNKDVLKASGISPQFTAFAAEKRAGVQMAKPIASAISCRGATPITAGKWASIKIQRAAGMTAVYVNGQLIAADTSPPKGGTIGFGAYHSKVRFDAVAVQQLTAVPEGHPTTTGCGWRPPVCAPATGPGDGEIAGDAVWAPAAAAASDRPGHEVTAGHSSLSLDGDWSFITDPNEEGEGSGYTDPDTSTWETRAVPGNWDVSDSHGTYMGQAWYARDFEAAPVSADDNERVWLRFGAVYATASVWLNGRYVGCHRGGYTPFEFDVTTFLVDGDNTLVVRADNSFQQGAWWSWGGISRSVELVKTDEVRIDRQQIVATPDLDAGTARVTSTVFVDNDASAERSVELTAAITDAATGAVIVDGLTAQLTVPAGKTGSIDLSADLAEDDYRLWDIDDPALYRFDVSLDAPSGHVDSAQSDRFGIRLFEISDAKMLLNGEPLRLSGANRVSDDPAHGNTEPLALVRRDLDRMKASGLDLTRIMHYAQSPELLDYADEIGMLLIDEVPVWQQGRDLVKDIPEIKQEFREMVERDFNHASIFAHSVANEISADQPHGKAYDKVMADYSREIDPSRFVTQATNTTNWLKVPENDGSQYMDFVSVNLYGDFAGVVEKVHGFWPEKPIFVSEYSPDGYTFGTERESLDFATGSGDTARIFAKKPYVFGWSQWTYNDYRSKFAGTGTNLVRGWGNQDVWGRLKTGYDATQEANAPVVLELGSTAVDGTRGVGIATITPRPVTGAISPLRTLRDHRLVVRASAADGTVVGGTIIDLPTLELGSDPKEIPLTWSVAGAAARVTATILSPAGYEIAVHAKDVAAPAAPQITGTVVADGALRVRFSDSAGIGRYVVTATAVAATDPAATVTTAEFFADLTGLSNGVAYTVRVAAEGTFGVGPMAEITLTPAAGKALPPKAIALTAVDRGLVLGFSDDTADATYDVNAVDTVTGADVTHTTSNRPGTRIEGLTPGHTYEVRIRRTAAGEWSEPLRGTPLGPDSSPALDVRGAIAGEKEVGIVLIPSPGTERYRVTVTGGGIDRSFDVERAAVEVLPIEGLAPSTAYTVTVAAVGPTGVSAAWSGTIETDAVAGAAAPSVPSGLVRTNDATNALLTWAEQDVDGFVVSRTVCGATTTQSTTTSEAVIGRLGLVPGSYTVRAVESGRVSGHTEAIEVPGIRACDSVVTPVDTAQRADGSVPYIERGTWGSSSLLAAGQHPTRYAELPANAGAKATYSAPLTTGPATYRVLAALPRSADGVPVARYSISDGTSARVVEISQNSKGKRWVDLGTIAVDVDRRATVTLEGGGKGFLRAAAVRFVPEFDPSTAPVAPKPEFADQTVAPGGPIVGRGTAGQTVTLTRGDGTVIAESTVGADGTWSLVPAHPLEAGATVMTATERDADGWIGAASATVTVQVADGAKAAPAAGVLSTNSGAATGLRDGSHRVTMNLWWGENASSFRLYENGILIATRALTPSSPLAQSVGVELTGRANGTYVYTGELVNSRGTTAVAPVTVEVTHASPGLPVLSDDNWDGDGVFTLTADMWWGTNATSYRFLEDGVVIAEGSLEAASPAAQRMSVQIRDRAPGTRAYTVEFENPAGTTTSAPRSIAVRAAAG